MARSCAGDMEIYSSIISEAVGGIIGALEWWTSTFSFNQVGEGEVEVR